MIQFFAAAALAALLGYEVVTHWDDICSWAAKLLHKLSDVAMEEALRTGDLKWVAIAVLLEGAAVAIEIRMSVKKGRNWENETATREISLDELPADIRNKVKRGNEVNITGYLKNELGL